MERKNDNGEPEYIDEVTLAQHWNVTTRMLQKWRLEGGHIPFYRIGGVIRYRITDVREYEASRRFTSTSEYAKENQK